MGQNLTCLNLLVADLFEHHSAIWKSKETQIAERHTHTEMGSTSPDHVCVTCGSAHAAKLTQSLVQNM